MSDESPTPKTPILTYPHGCVSSLRLRLITAGIVWAALGACSSAGVPQVPAGVDGAQDTVLVAGRQVYTDRCANCHGNKGLGGQGPSLADGAMISSYPDIADQLAVVADGYRLMPGFSDSLSAQEILAVVRFTREIL